MKPHLKRSKKPEGKRKKRLRLDTSVDSQQFFNCESSESEDIPSFKISCFLTRNGYDLEIFEDSFDGSLSRLSVPESLALNSIGDWPFWRQEHTEAFSFPLSGSEYDVDLVAFVKDAALKQQNYIKKLVEHINLIKEKKRVDHTSTSAKSDDQETFMNRNLKQNILLLDNVDRFLLSKEAEKSRYFNVSWLPSVKLYAVWAIADNQKHCVASLRSEMLGALLADEYWKAINYKIEGVNLFESLNFRTDGEKELAKIILCSWFAISRDKRKRFGFFKKIENKSKKYIKVMLNVSSKKEADQQLTCDIELDSNGYPASIHALFMLLSETFRMESASRSENNSSESSTSSLANLTIEVRSNSANVEKVTVQKEQGKTQNGDDSSCVSRESLGAGKTASKENTPPSSEYEADSSDNTS
eukprot:snap_masked-scaffold_1-processed-gene-3.14-mRNA-1 protein AED:1.00 eAED:1.00 QI:0/-1/0/0/-1/1/1/0/413